MTQGQQEKGFWPFLLHTHSLVFVAAAVLSSTADYLTIEYWAALKPYYQSAAGDILVAGAMLMGFPVFLVMGLSVTLVSAIIRAELLSMVVAFVAVYFSTLLVTYLFMRRFRHNPPYAIRRYVQQDAKRFRRSAACSTTVVFIILMGVYIIGRQG